jgi:hypothetical protein
MKYGKYIKDDGGRSKYYKINSHYGDCTIRTCAIATGLDYFDVFKELTDIGLEVGDLANSPNVYPVFLERHGFTKQKPPKNNKGKKIGMREFAAIAPKGNIVALTRTHLVAIIDNVQRDTWLEERCVNTWYHRENVK